MENAKKNLRCISILSLVFATFSFVTDIVSTWKALTKVESVPDGYTESIVYITAIVLGVISLILFLPRLYVGAKGIKVSNKPDASKGHIVWATIITVIAFIALLSPIRDMIDTFDVKGNMFNIVDKMVNVVIYCVYLKFAKQVLKAA